MDKRQAFLSQWIEKSTFPLALLGVLYLAFWAVQVSATTNSNLEEVLEAFSWAIWGIFAVDLLARLVFARSLKSFVKSSWLEIVALIIPFFRILRIFRILIAFRGIAPLVKSRMASTTTYIALGLPLVWFAGAIGVLDAEKNTEGAAITSLADALWWSLTTITTVGYGDFYPKSLEGKFVAAFLMLTGIALFSAGAGILGSWIMKDKPEEKNA
jgi:voltage-gated potassium channel